MFCQICGRKIPNDTGQCPYCNSQENDNKLQENIIMVSSKNKIIAIILCMLGFAGLGGMHRIYVGKFMSGFLYFITFGLLGIGTIVDLSYLCLEKFTDDQKFTLVSDTSMTVHHKRVKNIPISFIRKILIGVIGGCLLLFMMGGASYWATTHLMTNNQQDMEQRIKADEKEIKEKIDRENSKEVEDSYDKIKVRLELLDSVLNEKGERSFWVEMTNTSEYLFKGVITIDAKGIAFADRNIYVTLQPGQTLSTTSKGKVNEDTIFKSKIQGKFYQQDIEHNEKLKYEIVKKQIGTTMATFYIYTESKDDQILIGISKEFRDNYQDKYKDIEVRFVNKKKEPTLDDTYAMYSIHPLNKKMNHALILLGADGNEIRRIADNL